MSVINVVLAFAILALLALEATGRKSQKCCPDGECYDTGGPWLKQITEPQCVNDTDIYFALYTRETMLSPANYTLANASCITSVFKPNNPTVMLFHGWRGSANEPRVFRVVSAYLTAVPTANVFACDFSNFSKVGYLQAVSNIRSVARTSVKFLKYLIKNKGLPLAKIHVLGASLGAHLAGFVGKELPGIPHITGLDPAGPMFRGRDPQVRLSKGDAVFVEGVNTNGHPVWGIGTSDFDLDVNFLINGGYQQRGCLNKIINGRRGLMEEFFCSHTRTVDYYVEALTSPKCTFWGVSVAPYITRLIQISRGLTAKIFIKPSQCTKGNCIPMGIDSVKSPLRGQFVVRVNDNSPYCVSDD